MPNNVLGLTREQLSKFLPDQQSIRAFEKLVIDATTTTPENVEAVTNIANSALAMAAAAISQLSELVETLDAALIAPAPQPEEERENYTPSYGGSLGTMAYQNDDEVDITGGSIAGVTISSASGSFTNISYSGQLTSTVATGTAPMVVASTTKVTNLNVDLLDGGDWATPGTIGSTTPNSGVFTALSTNGTVNVNLGTDTTNTGVNVRGSNAGVNGGSFVNVRNNNVAIIGIGNKSALNGGAYDAKPYISANATIESNQSLQVPGGAVFLLTSSALTNGAGAAAGTITNAPTAGNPTKWIGINDNGTVRYIPAW